MLLIMPLGMSKTVINVARWPGMRSPPVRSTLNSILHTPCPMVHGLWPSAFQQVCTNGQAMTVARCKLTRRTAINYALIKMRRMECLPKNPVGQL